MSSVISTIKKWRAALSEGFSGALGEDSTFKHRHAEKMQAKDRLVNGATASTARFRTAETLAAKARAEFVGRYGAAIADSLGAMERDAATGRWRVREGRVHEMVAAIFEPLSILAPAVAARWLVELAEAARPADEQLPDLAARVPLVERLEEEILAIEIEHGRWADGLREEHGIALPLFPDEAGRRSRSRYVDEARRRVGPPAGLTRPTTFTAPKPPATRWVGGGPA